MGRVARAALIASGGEALPVPGFESSSYRAAGGEIIWLGQARCGMHPRMVVLAENASEVSGRSRFSFRQAFAWRAPEIPDVDDKTLIARCQWLCEQIEAVGVPRGFAAALAGQVPAFPLDRALAAAERFVMACHGDDPRRALEVAIPLLGVGPGLTPAGDDFVGGALFARRVIARSRRDSAAWAAGIDSFIAAAQACSHPISAALFSDLARLETYEAVHGFTQSMVEDRFEKAIAAARQLVSIGHSSGWDMLAGFVSGASGRLMAEVPPGSRCASA